MGEEDNKIQPENTKERSIIIIGSKKVVSTVNLHKQKLIFQN